MTFTLLEKKLVLQEHRLILNEALSQDLLDEKLKLVDDALAAFKSKSDPFSELKSAYNNFSLTLAKNNTTTNNASNLGEVEAALKSFWASLKSAGLVNNSGVNLNNEDGLLDSEVVNILTKNEAIISKVANFLAGREALPTEDGLEVNKKVLLQSAVKMESVFGNIIPKLQTASMSNSTDASNKASLEFIKKTLEIIKKSLTYIKDDKIKEEIETSISALDANTIKNTAVLKKVSGELNNLNRRLKNSDAAAAQKEAEASVNAENDAKIDWDDLYKNTMNKNAFWEQYFEKYWKANGNKIAMLGTSFKNECEVYGFTDKTNPFIRYLKNFLLNPEYRIEFNSGQYQAIHNLFVNRILKIADLPGYAADNNVNKVRELLTNTDLFKQSVTDMTSYLSYADKIRGANPDPQAFDDIMYVPDTNNLNKLSVVLVNMSKFGIESGNPAMSADKITDSISYITKTGKVATYISMLWGYFLDEQSQATYASKLDSWLSKPLPQKAILSARTDFIKSFGEPSVAVAQEILNKFIGNNANSTEATGEATNSATETSTGA